MAKMNTAAAAYGEIRHRAGPDRWPGSSRGTQDTFGRAVRDLKGFVRERSGEM